MDPPTAERVEPKIAAKRGSTCFHRPELDALRFFAFACVLVHHGAGQSGAFVIVRRAGAFGLSLFFLLSAYLITQILLQERAEWHTIHLKSFYMRRILRIWPLYYFTLTASILIGRIPPHRFAISPTAITGFSLFIANWLPRTEEAGLFLPMWSISIEEQFYLIWPLVMKLCGRASVIAVSTIFIVGSAATIAILSFSTWMLWYNTLVEFLFFGTGALLAVIVGGGVLRARPIERLLLFAAGLLSWTIASIAGVGSDGVSGLTPARLYIGFGTADLGCIFIFLAFLGACNFPRMIVYLGKISYGLYAFHLGMIELSDWLLSGMVKSPQEAALWKIAAVDVLALICCIGMAALSYRFFEKPFLRLKQRFEFVRSMPA